MKVIKFDPITHTHTEQLITILASMGHKTWVKDGIVYSEMPDEDVEEIADDMS